MKDKERLAALELENKELKNRVTKLEGYVTGLQILLEKYRRESKDQPIQPLPWSPEPWKIPNYPYIGTPAPPWDRPNVIWCENVC